MAKIKICGLKRLDDIEIVNKYKPDYIGFVFADSKRKVTSDLACKMKKNLDSSIKSVGVFVDEDIDVIIKLYDEGIIDIAQLHGLENEEYIKKLKQKSNYQLEIINAIEMSDEKDLKEYDNSLADYLLLDSGKGSGKTFDWRLIRKDLKKEFFLAGGLNSKNISKAIEEFNPYAVDLSSGVETDGYKDELKIKEVMEEVDG
ncbi:MAG: phosphoribosylanthranilate isomerase [Methanobrevibacter sp.]|uniref:phosphoribosylanthranilate isomerase n=1 Tax=uncultured Methanobrevibacter sp. TaxID=253161 RepID=UPI0025E86025|nr:phosphoribosylanthranilate isomerase [uncultured Methanobrevibacter sp.]MBQ2612809.1 phosphoribosylanthranilate isomerase [Methanobrevibacter sp.]